MAAQTTSETTLRKKALVVTIQKTLIPYVDYKEFDKN